MSQPALLVMVRKDAVAAVAVVINLPIDQIFTPTSFKLINSEISFLFKVVGIKEFYPMPTLSRGLLAT